MRSLSVFFVAAVALGACGAPADPASVQDRINQLVPEIFDDSMAAADGAAPTFDAMGRGLDALDVLAPGLLPAFGLEELDKRDAFGEEGQTGADIAAELNQTIFTEANYAGEGVYRVPATELCEDPLDTECLETFDRMQLKIRAELAGDGVDFTLLVGASQAEPVSVGLRRRALTVSVDLGELADAMRDFTASEPGWSIEMSGAISARLDVLGAAHVSLAFNVDDPIHLAVSDDGTDPVRFDTGEAQPLVRIELDGVAASGSAQLGLGSTQIHVPGDTEPAVDVDLPGLTALATLSAGRLVVSDLSLGTRTTTMSVGGQAAVTIDLNRDAGRAVDLTVVGDESDATFTVSPALDLRVAIDHAILGDTPPRYDVTRVALDGAGAPALHATTDLATGLDRLSVAAGVISIETNPAGYGATFTAGQCIGEEWRSDAAGSYAVLVPTTCQ